MDTALDLVEHAQAAAGGTMMHPLLGGGTRLMLSLHHRISDDIDLFIRDPQWIGYLTPRLNDYTEQTVDAYEENAISLKLRLAPGEIDFIVAMTLLNRPPQSLPGVAFKVESVAEVLAKKLFYRGSLLSARDLFDWWAIASMAPSEISRHELAELLRDRLDGIEAALHAMGDSQAAHRVWSELRAADKPPLTSAVDFAIRELTAFRSMS
jgi:predicted nucleotidyltransferase component of viral defense system